MAAAAGSRPERPSTARRAPPKVRYRRYGGDRGRYGGDMGEIWGRYGGIWRCRGGRAKRRAPPGALLRLEGRGWGRGVVIGEG